MQPLISIIIPIYNTEKYLPQCIDSILKQTYKNLEIILINDGSIDKSGAICEQYKKKDQRIVVVHKENGGRSSARNSGLDIANGKYIGFVDSDDFIKKEMYEELWKAILKKDADISACNFIHYNEQTQKSIKSFQFKEQLIGDSQLILKRVLRTSVSLCNKLFKKEIFNQLRFPLGKEGEDAYIAPYIYGRVQKMQFHSDAFYYYRKQDECSITLRKFQKGDLGILEANLHIYRVVKKYYKGAEEEVLFRILIALKRVIEKMAKGDWKSWISYVEDIRKCSRIARALWKKIYKSKNFDEIDKQVCLCMSINPYLSLCLVKMGVLNVYIG